MLPVLRLLACVHESRVVTGPLVLRGQIREVSFPARFRVSPAFVDARARIPLDLADFGIPDAADLLEDRVVLSIALHADRPRS